MIDLVNKKQKEKDIAQRRYSIYELFIRQSENVKSGTIRSVSSLDIRLLFELYDRIFLGNWLKDNFRGRLNFSLSRRMTKSAGITICPKNISEMKPEDVTIEIRIGVDFFFQYGLIKGSKTVCGIRTHDSLEALQLVFEHELCHVLEFILYKGSNCKGERFKTIASNIFGHTESYHRLPTNRQIASSNLGLHVGDTVKFNFEGRKMTGIINAINKRATVMVRDQNGGFVDSQGNRYSKYYIPLSILGL